MQEVADTVRSEAVEKGFVPVERAASSYRDQPTFL